MSRAFSKISVPARSPSAARKAGTGQPSKAVAWSLLVFMGLWLAFQVFYPLRHLLYPGSPSWNEEGHRFAWQMKLRDKQGEASFIVRDPETGGRWRVSPYDLLLPHQARKVATRPDMILQFAHYLARIWAEEHEVPNAEVRAQVCVSLNGRKAARLIDPERDLAKVERNLRHADWVLPLEQPFERPPQRTGRRALRC